MFPVPCLSPLEFDRPTERLHHVFGGRRWSELVHVHCDDLFHVPALRTVLLWPDSALGIECTDVATVRESMV